MPERTIKALLRRVSTAGFKPDFVRTALLPDWWSPECADDASLLPDLEFRVAKFLNASIEQVRTPGQHLGPPSYAGAQFRHSRGIERERLNPAVHAALRVAEAVVRNLRTRTPVQQLPPSGLQWRQEILSQHDLPDLDALVGDLWRRGIPVIQIEQMPSPKFQGMALVVSGRPVIVVGHGQDVPAWILFTVAHEAGHVAHGDCSELAPIVDESEEADVADVADIERRADRYAFEVLNGRQSAFALSGSTPKELAALAAKLEQARHVDAGHLLLSWARGQETQQAFQTAMLALGALWKKSANGQRIVRRYFDENVDVDAASEADRALLSCIYLEPERDEGAR